MGLMLLGSHSWIFGDSESGEKLKWFEYGAERGHHFSQFMLGSMYRSGGFGAEQSYAEAEKWWRLAANHKEADGSSAWMLKAMLKDMYKAGEAVAENYKETANLFRSEAQKAGEEASGGAVLSCRHV